DIYIIVGFLQMTSTYIYSERRKEELKLWPYVPMMSIYTGTYLRLIRLVAYIHEFVWEKSYDDPWNPVKSSSQAKANGF
ncbi:MAG: biofilm PGA synthesis N-glycosyltransferase PgaC, partial [Saprospiraceae bacterium]